MDKHFSEMTFPEQLSAYESVCAEVSRLKARIEAFQAQDIERQTDITALRHDLEVAEYERDEARKEIEEWRLAHSQPTEVLCTGTKIWKNQAGKLHRDGDKPAIVWADGTKEWYKNGKLHRDGDKPAVVWANGTKYWYKNDKFHRDGDKPAVVCTDGSKFWYKNGELHRDGGKPAMVWASGRKEWWIDGEFIKGEGKG